MTIQALETRLNSGNALRATASIVGAGTLLAYLPGLSNGFVNFWDDRVTILDNAAIRGLDGEHLRAMFTTFVNGHYQPLSLLSLAIDRMLWGDNPAGYHLTSAALHALNAMLLCGVIDTLLALSQRTPGQERWRAFAAGFGALIFSLHPLRVESVAWATERRDVLSGLFFLLALHAYLPRRDGALRRRPLLVLVWMLAGLLSKSILVTLPAALLALDCYPLRRLGSTRRPSDEAPTAGAGWRPALLEKLPLLLLAAPFMIIAHQAQQASGAMSSSLWRGGWERLQMSLDALVFYAEKTLLPINLSPLYALRPAGPGATRVVLCAALLLGAALWAWRARNRHRWLLAAGFAYLALASPILGFFQSGPQRAADRYTYLPMLPAALLAAAGLQHVLASAGSRRTRALWLAGSVTVLAVLAALTLRQIPVWHDPESLWSRVLAVEPDSRVGHVFQAREREYAAAAARIEPLARAANASPNDPVILSNLADALIETRRCPEATRVLDRILALRADDAAALRRRGGCRMAAGEALAAIRDFDRAVEINPGDRDSLLASALARQRLGDFAGAEPRFARALVADSEDWGVRANHATVLLRLGRIPEAEREMRLARSKAPKWGQAMIDKQAADLGLALNETPEGRVQPDQK